MPVVKCCRLVLLACFILAFAACNGGRGNIQAPRLFCPRTIELLGRQIYEQDRYAARATELLFQQAGTPYSLTREGLCGWICSKDNQGRTIVRFVKEGPKGVEAAYDIVFASFRDAVCRKAAQTTRLSRLELAQYKAKRLVAMNLSKREWPLYNLVVLPDVERKGLIVYAIAATHDPNLVIVGGHHRFTVSADGERIELAEKLFLSPLVLDKRSIPEGSGNCLFATYGIGDTPAETHVFLSLLHAQPLYIATRNGDLWRVEKGSMTQSGHLEVTSDGIHAKTGRVSSASAWSVVSHEVEEANSRVSGFGKDR